MIRLLAGNYTCGRSLAIVLVEDEVHVFERLKITALILTALVMASGCAKKIEAEEGCNFVQNGQMQRVSWKGRVPIEFYVHSSVPTQYYEAIRSAMTQWENKIGVQMFRLVGTDHGGSGGSKDGKNVIYLMNTWELENNREQGRTTIYWTGDLITEADMLLNASNFSFFTGDQPVSGAVDMESLVVHELGHVLGLQHNDIKPSVMATTLASANMRRVPKPVDVESLKCEYN